MSKSKNCPNCSAPYDIEENKCPYCGTIYFDMSIIDFDNQEPFYLKIKSHGLCFTQLVVPKADDLTMTISEDTTYVTNGKMNKISSFVSNKTASINVSFEAVVDKQGTLIRVKES